MSFEQFFRVEAWLNNIIITISSLIFLYSFCKLQTKTYAVYMVLILNITDLTFPFLNFLSASFPAESTISQFTGSLGPPLYRLSLYWSTAIAYFVYLVVKVQKVFNPRSFLIYSFFLSFTFAGLFSLM